MSVEDPGAVAATTNARRVYNLGGPVWLRLGPALSGLVYGSASTH